MALVEFFKFFFVFKQGLQTLHFFHFGADKRFKRFAQFGNRRELVFFAALHAAVRAFGRQSRSFGDKKLGVFRNDGGFAFKF